MDFYSEEKFKTSVHSISEIVLPDYLVGPKISEKKVHDITLPVGYDYGGLVIADAHTKPITTPTSGELMVTVRSVDEEASTAFSRRKLHVYEDIFEPIIATPLTDLGLQEVFIRDPEGTILSYSTVELTCIKPVDGRFSHWALTCVTGSNYIVAPIPIRILNPNCRNKRADLSSAALGTVLHASGLRIRFWSCEGAFADFELYLKNYFHEPQR